MGRWVIRLASPNKIIEVQMCHYFFFYYFYFGVGAWAGSFSIFLFHFPPPCLPSTSHPFHAHIPTCNYSSITSITTHWHMHTHSQLPFHHCHHCTPRHHLPSNMMATPGITFDNMTGSLFIQKHAPIASWPVLPWFSQLPIIFPSCTKHIRRPPLALLTLLIKALDSYWGMARTCH